MKRMVICRTQPEVGDIFVNLNMNGTIFSRGRVVEVLDRVRYRVRLLAPEPEDQPGDAVGTLRRLATAGLTTTWIWTSDICGRLREIDDEAT